MSDINPVLDLIRTRLIDNSMPNARSDSFKLGLAIEGGGMRGVVTAGMALGLFYLDGLNIFDAVYGTSAGAVNGAFFVSKQLPYGSTIYYEDINNRKFLNITNALLNKPIMSIDYLVDYVLKTRKILDCSRIIDSQIPLNIIVSSVSRLQSVCLKDFDSESSILEALRASTRLPFAGGHPVKIDNDLYLDGGIFESIPYKSAVADGCTHVLSLLSRPKNNYLDTPGIKDHVLSSLYLEKIKIGLGTEFINRPQRYNHDLNYLLDSSDYFSGPPYHFALQLPSKYKNISRMEMSRKKLLRGMRLGMKIAYKTISNANPVFHETLQPYDKKGHLLIE